MINVAIALYSFWSSFGIPAFPEGNVPDDAVTPYITYEITASDWRTVTSMHARVWYRDTSYLPITSKLDEISDRIGEGLVVPFSDESGFLTLHKDTQFIQFQPYEVDSDIKVAYLSIIQNIYE